jgi:hypothetical protein
VKPFAARVGLLYLIAAIAFVALAAGRTVSGARGELHRARAHLEEGQSMRALEHYRRALRWSFPLSPYVDEAVAGLESIARAAERAENRPAALLAWRSLAGGLAASRFSYAPETNPRERAKAEIARLVAAGPSPGIDANLDPSRVAADHRELLEREASPDPIGATLLVLGFIAWIASLVVLARRGFDSGGRLIWSTARAPFWSALAAFTAFALGLVFA